MSKELNIDIEVEVDLYEWIPDIVNFNHKTSQDCFDLCKDFDLHNGIPQEYEEKVWKTNESMTKRMKNVLEKYSQYKRVIVVCHGMVIRTIKYKKDIAYAEIIEYTT